MANASDRDHNQTQKSGSQRPSDGSLPKPGKNPDFPGETDPADEGGTASGGNLK
ncbi:hypothetical protein [Haliangium sp.]|uniref:hypothetical protein n=1 Tax=Haliangium sp. TaxID=2663208 RepID=UPI003D0A2377